MTEIITSAEIEIDQTDLNKAREQIALLEALINSYDLDEDTVASIQSDIDEIEEEAREYDYALNPRSAPELCGTCNAHPYVDLPDCPCANCGLPLERARPADGYAHWILPPGEPNQVVEIGEFPE